MKDKVVQASLFEGVKNKKVKGKKHEEKLQLAVCDYIRLAYPKVIFMCDLASGLRLPIWIAAMNKRMRSSRGQPDLFIAHSKNVSAIGIVQIHGLFIELKKEGTRLKNGDMPSDKHIKEQEAVLEQLRHEGYRAEFACGFDEAKKIIDEYMAV